MWETYGVRIGSVNIQTPPFQILSFGLLVLVCILNFDTIIETYLDFKEKRQHKMKENIHLSNEDILITGINFKNKIAWSEITQMNAYKKDFMTWDRVELEIVYGDRALTINEDVEGWKDFLIKVTEIFPTIPKDWDTTIIHPPFETNFTTIYSKV
jgi:hypothetical protein